jgi:hypothetical protein
MAAAAGKTRDSAIWKILQQGAIETSKYFNNLFHEWPHAGVTVCLNSLHRPTQSAMQKADTLQRNAANGHSDF